MESEALLLQGATLLRARHPLARAWCASRLGVPHAATFGTLREAAHIDAALARCEP